MARPEEFESPTPKFVAWCSIQLSYGRKRKRTIGKGYWDVKRTTYNAHK